MHRKAPALAGSALLFLLACASDSGDGLPTGPGDDTTTFEEPWPMELASILTEVFVDGGDDLELMPPEQAGPPYSSVVPFDPVDVTRVELGVDGPFLYMRVQFNGVIPTEVVTIPAEGEVELQWVRNQGMNVAMNTDGDIQTGGGGEGVYGIDIFFAVGFHYGQFRQAYCNYDFPTGDLHQNVSQRLGELGDGGPGFDYVVVRYKVDGLGTFFPLGSTVDLGSWSEGESYNADGSLKYHHFAFDRVIDGGRWALPAP